MSATVAILFADPRGIYSGRSDIDLWDEARDARTYPGTLPVVAHPPCRTWSAWLGFKTGLQPHEDGGCFAAALAAVETYGGVIEHPAHSRAWRHFGIAYPLRGAWILTTRGGWTCEVEQGQYGHRARKTTWLYYFGTTPPPVLVFKRERERES